MIGTTLSHFKITAKLGEGGMGEVYEAWDESLERTVALKILPTEMVQNPDRVRRFVQEAKSASALSHPHIVTIHEIGHVETAGAHDVHFIAMELIDGHTLKTKIHEEHLGAKDLLRWLGQAAEGLSKAHADGIVHRDLKPDNIMVTSDGYAKVLDFGLAKLTEPLGDGTLAPTFLADETAEGAVLGTVGYMSPEQVQGKTVDQRTDIFSFGCVLYEAMTRQRPFAGETAVDTMHQILRTKPAPVRELSPETPGAVRRVIRRCLAKDPERRLQSMKDLALELNELVEEWDELGLRTDSSTWGESGSVAALSPPRNERKWFAVGALAAAVVLAGLLLVWRPWKGASEGTDSEGIIRTSFSQITQQAGFESQGDLSSDGRFISYVSREKGHDDIYLLRIGGRNPVNLTASSDADDQSPMFSPDGEQLAFRSGRDDGGLFVMGATGESVRRLTDFGHDPAWSPDGREIAFVGERTVDPAGRTGKSPLWLIDSSGGAPRELFEGDAMRPRWSPSGTRIVFWAIKDIDLGGGQRDIASISLAEGEPVWLTDDDHLDWSPVWSPDGRFVYFLSDRGGSRNMWRIAVEETSGGVLGDPQPVTVPSRGIDSLSISSDGTRILYTDSAQSANITKIAVDPSTFEPVGTPKAVTGGSASYVQPQVSPSGEWIAFRTAGKQEDLYLIRPDGTELRQLTDDLFKDRLPLWFPDSESIVFYSDRSGRYEAWSLGVDGSDLQQLTSTTGDSFYYPNVSPDGRLLVATNEFQSDIWDLSKTIPASESRKLPQIMDTGRFMFNPTWSPDGRRLAGSIVEPGQSRTLGVAVFSMETEEYEVVFAPEPGPVIGAPFWGSELNRVFFWMENPATDRVLHLMDVVSGEVRELWTLPSQSFGHCLAMGDEWLFYTQTSGESDLWMATLE